MNENVAQYIIDCDKIGQQISAQFSNERLTSGKLSVWDKMKKTKKKEHLKAKTLQQKLELVTSLLK